MNDKKVAVAACTGLDQPLGTVARKAGYQVLDKLRPEKTVLLCTPALIAGVKEDVVYAKENPVLVIDGCEKACCEKIVREIGGNVTRIIEISEVQKQHGNLQPDSRRKLGPEGKKLVNIVAKLAAEEVDRILEKET